MARAISACSKAPPASTDTLLLYNEFPAPVVSAGGNFALTPSTLRLG